MKSLWSAINTVGALALGVTCVGGLMLLIQSAFAPRGSSQPLRIMGFELTALGLLSVLVLCGCVLAVVAWHTRSQKRVEREVLRVLQEKRRIREER